MSQQQNRVRSGPIPSSTPAATGTTTKLPRESAIFHQRTLRRFNAVYDLLTVLVLFAVTTGGNVGFFYDGDITALNYKAIEAALRPALITGLIIFVALVLFLPWTVGKRFVVGLLAALAGGTLIDAALGWQGSQALGPKLGTALGWGIGMQIVLQLWQWANVHDKMSWRYGMPVLFSLGPNLYTYWPVVVPWLVASLWPWGFLVLPYIVFGAFVAAVVFGADILQEKILIRL